MTVYVVLFIMKCDFFVMCFLLISATFLQYDATLKSKQFIYTNVHATTAKDIVSVISRRTIRKKFFLNIYKIVSSIYKYAPVYK